MRNKRRNFLKLAGITGLGIAAYSYYRGMRIPPFVWEPMLTARRHEVSDRAVIESAEMIRTIASVQDGTDISLRAYAPEPALLIESLEQQTLRVSINNIMPEANLELISGVSSAITETVVGISRILEITSNAEQSFELKWTLPSFGNYKFASIGDTGGAQELAWCIQRAHDLGAKFLLHLGDLNYQAGDYQNAIRLFNSAPLPCYVSIGNHDFHDNGPQYQHFLNDIGPLNHQFSIGNTRFANLDTASNTLPYNAGHRGRLMQHLIADVDNYSSTIAFTHRPLYDPIIEGDHDMGSIGERDWMIRSLKQANALTLLSGHIHIQDRRNFQGIDNIIVGQGLGHQDLITDSDYSKMAIGHVQQNGQVEIEFAALSMPMEIHCHPRSDVVKESLKNAPHAHKIGQITQGCKA